MQEERLREEGIGKGGPTGQGWTFLPTEPRMDTALPLFFQEVQMRTGGRMFTCCFVRALPLNTTPSVKRRGPAGVWGVELGTGPYLCFGYNFVE